MHENGNSDISVTDSTTSTPRRRSARLRHYLDEWHHERTDSYYEECRAFNIKPVFYLAAFFLFFPAIKTKE